MPETGNALKTTLQQLARENRLRSLKTISEPQRPEVTLNGRRVVDFCSNDYLGLMSHPDLIQASQAAIAKYGTGAGGARLIGGTLDLHMTLEDELRAFKGTEAALVFNSGYQANVGVLSALVGRNDLIFSDRLNHASIVDGAILSRARQVRYPHLDCEALEKRLQDAPEGVGKFIVTDSVFSMDGDKAPLKELYALACRYDAWLIVDEAHGTGVFGDQHRSGLWETTGIGPDPRVIQIGTFSKALGSFGAYVAASAEAIQSLLQFSRSFIYSTALPPAVIAANLAAVRLVMSDGEPARKLWENVRQFQQASQAAGFSWAVESPIIPVVIGDSGQTLAGGAALLDAGFYVQAIRPPTVPEGTARLRITLSASHTPDHIAQLVESLGGLL